MITDLVISFVASCVTALTTLVPSFTLPGPSSFSTSWLGALSDVSSFVPIAALCGVLAALVALRAVFGAWDLLIWVYHQFWGSD